MPCSAPISLGRPFAKSGGRGRLCRRRKPHEPGILFRSRSCLRAARRARPRAGNLARAPRQIHRALVAGRRHRPLRAAARPGALRVAQAAIHRRQPAGRERQHRRRSGGEVGARRLHLSRHGESRDRGQPEFVQEPPLQCRARLYAGRAGCRRAARDLRSPFGAREDARRARRAGQARPREAFLRLRRNGEPDLSRHPHARGSLGREVPARALQGHRQHASRASAT